MMYPQFSSRNMMSHHASACQAEASFSCAHPACYASDNTIALILDAIILASIIIFGLVRLVSLGLHRKEALTEHFRKLETIWDTYEIYLEEEGHHA